MSEEKGIMTLSERHEQVESYLGKVVTIDIDRPIGYLHHKGEKTLLYPINYGYIPGVLGGDGEELDVFLVGVNEAVTSYTGRIIATPQGFSGSAILGDFSFSLITFSVCCRRMFSIFTVTKEP